MCTRQKVFTNRIDIRVYDGTLHLSTAQHQHYYYTNVFADTKNKEPQLYANTVAHAQYKQCSSFKF